MVSRLGKWCIVLGLTLACSMVFALDIFSVPAEDQSMLHLYRLFGAVGNQLGPNVQGRQLMGTLIRWLNLGLLSFVTIMITYTIIMGVVKTAQEGALMGRDGKAGWTAIRSALGIALLVPGSTGYSLIQIFIMWVVIQGVGLADTIWNTGARYMDNYGSAILSTDTPIEGDTAEMMAMKISMPESMVPMALSVASSDICANYINDTLKQVTRDGLSCMNVATMKRAVTQERLTTDNPLALCQQIALSPVNSSSRTHVVEGYTGDAMDVAAWRNVEAAVMNNLTTKRSELATAISGLPSIGLYMATRGSVSNASDNARFYPWSPTESNNMTNLFAVYGVKKNKENTPYIHAVCGAYKLGQVRSSSSDASRYSAFQGLRRGVSTSASILYESSFRHSARTDLHISNVNFTSWAGAAFVNQWETAVKRGIQAWRTVIAPALQSESAGALAPVGNSIRLNEGWIYAGGYYYDFSRASNNSMTSLTTVANGNALCSFISGDIPASGEANLTSVNASISLAYPFKCDGSSSSGMVRCRRDWNQMPGGSPTPSNLPSGITQTNSSTACIDGTRPSGVDQQDWITVNSIDLLSNNQSDSQNLAYLWNDSTSNEVRGLVRLAMERAGNDFWHGLTHQLPAKFNSIKIPLINAVRSADKLTRDAEEARRAKTNTARQTPGDSMRSSKRATATGIFLMMLGVQSIMVTMMTAFAGNGMGAVIVGSTLGVIFASAAAWTALLNSGDPIYNMIVLGQVMGGMALIGYAVVGVGIGLLATMFGTMNSMHGLTEGMKVALNWLAPLFQLVFMIALANAGMLSIYVPMIPLMIYLFAALGWMITVLEAIIAGPLIAIGITHPQGHDLLGKSEQAMMMLISVFLRPALITIGFFASILFVRIAFDIFLGTITHFLFTAMTAYSVNMVIGMTFLTVYTIVSIGVVEVAFSLINVIPERVMHWIGVQGMAQDHSRQTMQMAQSSSRGVGESAGRSMGSGFSGMQGWDNDGRDQTSNVSPNSPGDNR